MVGSRAQAAELDLADPLRGCRARFVIPDERLVYLDGNSLGRLPAATLERLHQVAEGEWGERIVRAWDEGWLELPVEIGDALAAAALGAAPGQTVIGDSTTVCFYKLASAAIELRGERRELVADVDNFPTDRYVIEGLARAHGLELRWLQFDPALGPTPEAVAAAIGDSTALATFSHVGYRSAYVAPMREINDAVHAVGALALWDLSHSAGAVPLALDADRCDLAVGCTYKYLNGGPGSPAYMYLRHELQLAARQPIWGWLGRRDPFAMGPGYAPIAGVRGLLSGTPPVLSMVGVQEGVRIVAEAGIDRIRAKGIALTELAIALIDERLAGLGAAVASPRESSRRGAHVALAHPDARSLCARLIERGVIVDFRRPDVIRLGLSPLTTRFTDVWDGVEAIRLLLGGR